MTENQKKRISKLMVRAIEEEYAAGRSFKK